VRARRPTQTEAAHIVLCELARQALVGNQVLTVTAITRWHADGLSAGQITAGLDELTKARAIRRSGDVLRLTPRGHLFVLATALAETRTEYDETIHAEARKMLLEVGYE